MTSPEERPGVQEVVSVHHFALHQTDVLHVSITINVCLLLQVPVGRLVTYLLSRYGGRRFKSLASVVQDYPSLPGRLLMEHGVLLVIVLLTILETFHSNIRPFSADPSLQPHTRLRLVYALSIGRFLVVAANNLCFYDVMAPTTAQSSDVVRSLTGHTGKPSFDFIYCVISIVSNVISLGYGENHLLVVTSSFIELNGIHITYRRISKMAQRRRAFPSPTRCSLKASFLNGFVCLVTRILLPLIFLGLAVSKESPLVMGTVPLLWFVFCCIFFGFFHLFLIYHCIRGLIDVMSYNPLPSTFTALTPSASSSEWTIDRDSRDTSSNGQPFAIPPYLNNYFTNDLHQPDCDLVDKNKGQGHDANDTSVVAVAVASPTWLAKPWNRTLSDLNNGLMRCYDNRNLCNSDTSALNEIKVNNVGNHKNSPVNEETFEETNNCLGAKGSCLTVKMPKITSSILEEDADDHVKEMGKVSLDLVNGDGIDWRHRTGRRDLETREALAFIPEEDTEACAINNMTLSTITRSRDTTDFGAMSNSTKGTSFNTMTRSLGGTDLIAMDHSINGTALTDMMRPIDGTAVTAMNPKGQTSPDVRHFKSGHGRETDESDSTV